MLKDNLVVGDVTHERHVAHHPGKQKDLRRQVLVILFPGMYSNLASVIWNRISPMDL